MILAVATAWNLQLESISEHVTNHVGFAAGSAGQAVTEGLVIPASIGLVAGAAQLVYRRWLWRLGADTDQLAGRWVYMLVARTNDVEIPIVGWFTVRHGHLEVRVMAARAYYLDDDGLVYRGDWTSDAMWVTAGEMGIVFSMRGFGAEREPMPSEYRGYVGLRRELGGRRAATRWIGTFHDLGDRSGVHGPVVCRRLRRGLRHRRPARLIGRHLDELRSSVYQVMGRQKIDYDG